MGNDRWAIREGDWKLLGNPIDTSRKGRIKKDELFLVNLKKDVSEMKNLASDYPKKVKHLEKIYREWEESLQR